MLYRQKSLASTWHTVNSSNTDLVEIKDILLQLKESFQKFKEDTDINFNNLNTKFSIIDKFIIKSMLWKQL